MSDFNPAGYNDLPASIKAVYTPKEYAWLSDAEKASLVQRETEPEWTEP
jgi:hypothetical protein